jgi:hypothetical protein
MPCQPGPPISQVSGTGRLLETHKVTTVTDFWKPTGRKPRSPEARHNLCSGRADAVQRSA